MCYLLTVSSYHPEEYHIRTIQNNACHLSWSSELKVGCG